ncbi:Coiled-coil domain-containing protein 162 [Collichthys lucidus]|uniref:Coiled-coil domain-containing protein 162 n=1 Tax=Collichthys lucidus TaxID=240159 RepID=A0A4U5VIR4_COLLU|nr:Coiled-coil domain-containing protein 162 [Collichthys lucidus]
MEAELSRQLSALRVEIEENGAVTSKRYSSVPPPKDISFFRTEREHTLRRGLQVAEALPVQSPADVMQRELDSCLSLEYTPDSLPPLLHQFYTDRSYHLAQIKYLLMLRWRRFCRHASVIEKLYPHYKDQVSNLTSEYEDAVQRARRLSASRERILSGRGNPANLLAQDDVVIYLRWLVCHLHSVQHVYNFLTVLHYMPACERKEKKPQAKESVDGISGPAHSVPLHTAHLEEFLPELQDLLAHFHLSYDARRLRSSADEMELFSVVWREFRTMFRHQERMKTFPQYGGTEVRESQWGRKSASSALRKEADWMPFIQVKPRRDPWQQKLVTKLKEKKRVDELLKMHSSFLQVSDLHDVAAALKEHSAASASRGGEARRHEASEIWTSIYSAASPARARIIQETRCGGRGDHDRSLRSQSTTGESYSFMNSLQLLGLDDSLEEGSSDAMVTRGAYLSLMHLRHLKLRQLQRVSLGLLNYLRSVERSLTFDLAGLQLEDRELCSTAEETGWMNAAGGGRGEAGGLGAMQYSHNTPVDCKVRCSEFMEFAEVENLHDFYSSEGRFVHTQDQRGFYIVYDAALKDLEELENELLLVGSHFIQRNRMKKSGRGTGVTAGVHSGSDFDRVALLLDLWTCETEFLESKVQLLNCYYEAYQHAAGTEERCALARVITDIMHSRPQLDLNQDYFVQVYRAEIGCLRSHQQLIKNILDNQIEKQRQYLQRIWRDDRKNSVHDYGLPPNYVPKHLVSLGGSRRVHPSLCLASAVYHGLVQAHSELCQLHRATSITDKLALRQQLLQQALQSWSDLAPPGVSYSAQIQKDLFSDFFFEDPYLVQKVGLRFISSAEERDMTQGRERQAYAVETFSRLLELVTIRHRLLGSASETAHLAQLYRHVASELGFDDFHLHLRPVQFEVAEQKDKAEPRPVFITATLEDDSCVDRFTPSHLPLSIQELDENQTGRFSFSSEEAVIHLMNKQSVENLQVTLACQVTQKNALMSALKLVCLCRRAESVMSSAEIEAAYHSDKEVSKPGRDTNSLQEKSDSSPSARTPTTTKERLMEAFVSIQLEKVGLRDEMLNSFRKKKQAAGGLIKTPEEAAEIKRRLIMDFLKQFSTQISQYGVRAQIVAYYYSLNFLLDDIPSIRRSHFTTSDLCPDLRMLQRRQLLSADGKTLLNLWFLPPFSQVLHVFKTLDVSECAAALRHTLQIVSALHDIVYYLVSFSRLGNAEDSDAPGSLAADWGGTEGIGAELLEIQHQVERLSDPSCPESVGCLLQLRRQILLLQFDTAVRHLIREVLLSSGDVASYQSVTDNMASALPLLSDSIQADVFSATLPVPRPLQARGCQAQRMYPWRSFTACQGLFPLHVWDVPPIEYCMQLCLSGLSDRRRLQANAAILGVSLLMEDVLNSGREAEPGDELCLEAEAGKTDAPIRVQLVLKGFLLMMKQLQVFKESWARTHLGVQTFRTAGSYQQFVKLYRAEIFYPSMRALAEQTRKERDYEVLISGSQALLPPPGASEVDVKAWQLHKLLESAECDMIRAVQRRISGEMTLWPQIVETFIQQLMEGAEEADGQLRVSQDRLQRCLTHLGCSLTERERRSFLLYSQFYEQILQQETQLLCQREQDLKNLKDSQTSNSHKEAAAVCRGMMLEISALKAQVAHLEQEKSFLEERLSLKFKERYDPLVRHLVSTCIQLKARLDEHSRQMEQDVSEMVNRTRGEGVDRIIKLKKKYGCTKDNDGLTLTRLKKEEVHELQQENSRLTALLCKLRAVSSWRRLVDQEKLHRQLLQTQQREISCRAEALRVKMMSEEEVVLLQEELDVVGKVLSRCQAECSSTKKLLSRKTEELQVSRHQSAQEACSRQELDSYRVQSLEQMRADVQDRERQVRALSEQLDRGSRVNQLHRQRSAKEIRQVKGKLQQALSLKQEAFQRVDKLQDQVNDMEAAFSRCTSMTGPHRTGQQQQLQLGSLSNYNTLQDSATQSRHQRAETARSRPDTRIDRPKAVSEPERHSEVNLNKNTNLRVLQ